MIRTFAVAFLLLAPLVAAQTSLGPVLGPINDVAGQVVPPAVSAIYGATGQNITREDVRLFLDLNITKGGVGVLGLMLGSGKAELDATIHIRGELRVISSDRIRAALEGENAYDISAENATGWSDLYLPAEVFRATLAAEVIAAFQEEQENALRAYVVSAVPELEIISMDIAWENVHPYEALSDLSLTEPPIVFELNAAVRYLRVESIPSLLGAYLSGKDSDEKQSKQDYIADLKAENSDPLRARDFFAAAAFSQLLNLSMQPGWSLEINIALPRGYSIEYANEALELDGTRKASFFLDAQEAESDVQEVIVFSITHRKGVITALFVVMVAAAGLLNLMGRWAYNRYRMPHHRERLATDS